jgi:hypothetical protein
MSKKNNFRGRKSRDERRLSLLLRLRKSKKVSGFFNSKPYKIFANRASKIFEMPEGKLVSSNGPVVARFVAEFINKNGRVKYSPAQVFEKLGKKIVVKLLQVPVSDEVLAKNYASRSAEEILSDRRVFMSHERGKIAGCVDYTHVAIACARRLGFKALFYRSKGHSKALVFIDGKFYFWDPMILLSYGPEYNTLNEIDLNGFDLYDISIGDYKLGRDASDVGLSFHNFF